MRGCAPAWKPRPDGDLTFVRDGSLVELEEPCRWERADCLRVVLSGRTVDRQLRRAWHVSSARFEIRRIRWLRDERLAAVVRRRARTGADFLAVFSGSRLVRVAVPERFAAAPCRPRRVPLRYPDGRKIFAFRGCSDVAVPAPS